MACANHNEYPPLNTLKPVSDDVWIVDGPTIRFGPPGIKIPFPTRMTVIRIAGDLFLHSPTRPTPQLVDEIRKIGAPRWLIGPNRLHYWWIPDWHRAFPDAEVHLAPRVTDQADGRIDFDYHMLDGMRSHGWDDVIETLPVASKFLTEIVFFHGPSRALILTDLIENFEPDKLQSVWMRWLTRLGGVQDPDGQMPRDMRLMFCARKTELREAVQTMIGWEPERIILAHGRWYERNGTAELRRAFRWILD